MVFFRNKVLSLSALGLDRRVNPVRANWRGRTLQTLHGPGWIESFALECLFGVRNSQVGGFGLGVVRVVLPLAAGRSPAKQLIWRRNGGHLDGFGVVNASQMAADIRRRHGRAVFVVELGGDRFAG